MKFENLIGIKEHGAVRHRVLSVSLTKRKNYATLKPDICIFLDTNRYHE